MSENNKLFEASLVSEALKQAVVKLSPKSMFRNPVMFTVEIGTAIMLVVTIYTGYSGDRTQGSFGYNLAVFIVLLLTLLSSQEITSR